MTKPDGPVCEACIYLRSLYLFIYPLYRIVWCCIYYTLFFFVLYCTYGMLYRLGKCDRVGIRVVSEVEFVFFFFDNLFHSQVYLFDVDSLPLGSSH